ncbi:RNA helicase-like protein (ISS) [Dorcoceras hygrometricum]|uniref:RNA helicase-like protein (ISS) n=1 Tax=Dorcoceras hygrometricum TaxID=472368 RepID=A0A2Z7BZV8_9LAMI|nr:RNA helicase-like protein (ISS) [Dorcoceras hygrometricum]
MILPWEKECFLWEQQTWSKAKRRAMQNEVKFGTISKSNKNKVPMILMPPHKHIGTRGPSTPPSTLPTSSKARAIKERAHLGSPGRGLEDSSGVTPREAPEHLRLVEELRCRGSNVSSG